MGAKKDQVSAPWTDAERETLRRMGAAGNGTRQIAGVLGRPVGGTQTMATRLGLSVRVLKATQERIRELAAEGWASSRIARRLQLPVEAVDRITGRTPS